MASPTRLTWVWINSGNWWWTGRPGTLQFMGSQRVGHDWVTEMNYRPDLEKVATLREKLWDYKLGVLWASKSLFLLQKRKRKSHRKYQNVADNVNGFYPTEESLHLKRHWSDQGVQQADLAKDGVAWMAAFCRSPPPREGPPETLCKESQRSPPPCHLQQWLGGEVRRALSNESTAKSHCPHSHLVTRLNPILISNNIKRQPWDCIFTKRKHEFEVSETLWGLVTNHQPNTSKSSIWAPCWNFELRFWIISLILSSSWFKPMSNPSWTSGLLATFYE